MIGETAIFLDLAGNRYFRLTSQTNAAFVSRLSGPVASTDALIAAGLDARADAAPVTMPILPVTTRHRPDVRARFNLVCLFRTIICQRRIERRLKSWGLPAVLEDLHIKLHASALAPVTDQAPALQIVAAFDQARLVRSAVDRCLPRSIALAQMLAKAGYRSQVILGVKLQPFAAHCWVQSGGMMLNESPEEAARYTPILIL